MEGRKGLEKKSLIIKKHFPTVRINYDRSWMCMYVYRKSFFFWNLDFSRIKLLYPDDYTHKTLWDTNSVESLSGWMFFSVSFSSIYSLFRFSVYTRTKEQYIIYKMTYIYYVKGPSTHNFLRFLVKHFPRTCRSRLDFKAAFLLYKIVEVSFKF